MHLLAEAGKDEISFLLFSKQPFVVHGFYVYSFNKHISPAEYAASLQKIIHDEHSLAAEFASCTVLYNTDECVLVPEEYFAEADRTGICDLMFGENRTTLCFHDNVKDQRIKAVYRLPQKIYDTVNAAFPKSSFSHATCSQLAAGKEDLLQCIVYHNNIKLILFKEGALQIVRLVEYASPADVCYQLLNTCRQFGMSPDSVNVLLSGMIEKHSNLYKEIYRYFLNISFSALPEGVALDHRLEEYPHHFYTHLISLAQCV